MLYKKFSAPVFKKDSAYSSYAQSNKNAGMTKLKNFVKN